MRSTVMFARVAICVTVGSVALGAFAGTAAAQPALPAYNVVCDLTTQLQFPLLCGVPLPEVPSAPTTPTVPALPTLPTPDVPVPVPALPLPLPALPGVPGGGADDGAGDDLLGEGGTVDELLGDEGVVDEFLNGSDGTGGVGDTDDIATGGGVVVIAAVDDVVGEDGIVDELLGGDGVGGRVEDDVLDEGGTVDELLCTISQVLQVNGSTCATAGNGNAGGGSAGTTTPSAGGVRGGNATNSSGSSLPVTGTSGLVTMLGVGGALTALGALARRSLRLRVA